jgi:hypothetical protein
MHKIAHALLIACVLVAAGAVQAQNRYTCRSAGGSAYISDRPCAGTSNGGVVYYGPSETPPRYEAPIPRIGEAPPHVKYMNPRCSSLNDALRTAHARGLRSETISTMQKDYRQECGENESEAYAKLSQEKRETAQQRRAEQTAEKQERDRASLREQQCGESKRILVTKRSRTDLNEGERAELRRFEENYRARCG